MDLTESESECFVLAQSHGWTAWLWLDYVVPWNGVYFDLGQFIKWQITKYILQAFYRLWLRLRLGSCVPRPVGMRRKETLHRCILTEFVESSNLHHLHTDTVSLNAIKKWLFPSKQLKLNWKSFHDNIRLLVTLSYTQCYRHICVWNISLNVHCFKAISQPLTNKSHCTTTLKDSST